jgi:DnaJ-class molecular chaperone
MAEKTAAIKCPECGGKGFVVCHDCHGQGRMHSTNAAQRPCRSCHGTGKGVCPRCGGAKKVAEEK